MGSPEGEHLPHVPLVAVCIISRKEIGIILTREDINHMEISSLAFKKKEVVLSLPK